MSLALPGIRTPFVPLTAVEILAKRGIRATEPEAIAYLWLEGQGYSEEEGTMDFQSGLWGGRAWLGGRVVDFILYMPGIRGIQIIGEYWHRDPIQQQDDEDTMARLEQIGIPTVRVRDSHLYAALDQVMSDAIQGIEWEQLR